MNGEAALSTGLVHLLGAIFALMPLGHRPPAIWGSEAARPKTDQLEAPALALVPESRPRGARGDFGLTLSAESRCPSSPPVDIGAQPDFPLFGDARPFQRVPRARWSPILCARIGRGGRILELRQTIERSGSPAADRATLRELSRLTFRPARRDGAPVEAWHRILVNLPETAPAAITEHPTACLMPEGTLPCEVEPMIIAD
jgi:hypothetical protein